MSSASISRFLLLVLLITSLHLRADGLPNVSTQTPQRCFVSADFLAWYPSEEVASIWADIIRVGDNTSSWGVPSFKLKWDYGFRIGTGYNLVYDQWDTALSWTWFRSEADHKIPIERNTTLNPEFFAAFLSDDIPESMHGKWSLLFNMLDWELGRSYWISNHLSLRPFLGLKGGWINQSIHIKYNKLIINHISTTLSGHEHLKNNFWGIGPVGGVNTKWRVCHGKKQSFDLFGDFSFATLWGTWNCSDIYQNAVPKTSLIGTKNSTLGALMFRGFLGVEWDISSRFTTKLGYEMQLWINQLRLATFQLQRLHHDLSLQGITFDCRFNF